MAAPAVLAQPARPEDLPGLAQVLADAFDDLPPSRWLIGDDADREKIFPGYFRLLLDTAMATGLVMTSPGRDAAALWIPSAAAPLSGYDTRLAALVGRHLARFRQFDSLMEEHHPGQQPHDWLAVIGTRPDRQGRGAGSALLAARHRDLDRQRRGAYLEAATLRARNLYLRHGYADLGEPIGLPAGPLMYPMWRDAQLPAGGS
jgi:GNAT superfamily N-acetyltransferase